MAVAHSAKLGPMCQVFAQYSLWLRAYTPGMGGRVGSLLGIISTSLLLGPETSGDPCWSFKKVSILVW